MAQEPTTTSTTTVEPTTTTTTVAPTTTTTTEAPKGDKVAGSQEAQSNPVTTDTTTVTAGEVSIAAVEKRGEVVVDNGANAKTLQEQPAEERIAEAQDQALANHRAEHAGDAQTEEERVSRDKPQA